jgi:hypothetical protein
MSITSAILLDCFRWQKIILGWFLRVFEVQGAGLFEGGEAALEVDGVTEAGGFQLAQGFVGAHPGDETNLASRNFYPAGSFSS